MIQRLFLSMLCSFAFASLNAYGHIKTLYNSLDTASIPQHLAFYELYPSTPEGKSALQHAWKLLAGNENIQQNALFLSSAYTSASSAVSNLINKPHNDAISILSDDEVNAVNILGQRLANRKLKGYQATTEKDVLLLEPDQVDLARGLFLTELGEDTEALKKIRSYEALMDLMALQILSKLPQNPSPLAKVKALNEFIFEEQNFRFPPHSLYAKDIDVYTFLPHVLDSRRGVCLGVSILYICLAQRLNLPLEMVTPPGHIYVRYRDGDRIINIETTARGINLESEEYLGINTRLLQQRNVKDIIGLAHFNQASVHWQQEKYEKALASYQKAYRYLPDDMLLKELMGYSYLFGDQIEKGQELLKQVSNHTPDYAVYKETIAEDYLNGKTNIEGIKAIFMPVDELRESIIKKRKALEKTLKEYPTFRAALFNLAVTWLQLHRTKEALEILEQYHALESKDPAAEYYLAALYAVRLDYDKAWDHLKNAEKITRSRNHDPKPLRHFRLELALQCPE